MRSPAEIMSEAKDVASKFRAQPKNATKDPREVARLLALFEERGLNVRDFAKAVGLSDTTIFLWSKGRRTAGGDWPELQAELAAHRGATLAAVINDGVPRREAANPATTNAHPAIKTRDAARSLRTHVLAQVEAITATAGWQGEPASIARVIAAYRQSKWPLEHFAATTGMRPEVLRLWNAGRDKTGGKWSALVNALASAGLKPSTRAMTREAVTTLNGPAATQERKPAAHAFSGVEEVRMYRDQAGTLHATPFEAHQANDRAERQKHADNAALWIGEQVAVDTIGLARALLADDVAPALWGIVQGRVARSC
jgi:hypothetical protein